MANILWACWDGGGNLTPSLGIANELAARGHTVQFYGRPEMVERVETAGLTATAFTQARTDLERYSFHPLATVFGYTSSPAVGEELVTVVASQQPDLVVIDAMFAAALDVAPQLPVPTVVMLHTFFDRLIDGWRANFTMQSESRQRAGFTGLPDLDTLWGERDLLHVTTLAALDGEPATSWQNTTHGAPVLAAERRAVTIDLPWDTDDPTPVVLLSFSTVPEQRNVVSLQTAIDALADLPVHVVGTTGGIVDPAELTAAPNAYLVPFADHETLMSRASLVVGHGGHGTTMRALRRGLPIVGIPAKGADQAPITALLEQWGIGRALPTDANAEVLRKAADEVLGDASFRDNATSISREFIGKDGAKMAADSAESLLPRS